ncbi:type IV pilus modification PilV family protein [Gorillibacterium sp. sgz5001074]|uniref:type IV pilus modification PilV family protein n=1 Tax=Gorillibacterium sp. sgz5001074 TaxID=3446695 RepID=UPI003F67CDAC
MSRLRLIRDERGISLVEILIAVTIMAFITATLMGYFMSAMEKSADQSRRVIAANLARLKVAEIRKVFQESTKYELLEPFLNANTHYVKLTSNSVSGLMSSAGVAPLFGPNYIDLSPTPAINGTVYHYNLEIDDKDEGRNLSMEDQMVPSTDLTDYLISMKVTVYWTAAETATPSGAMSTFLESYIRKGDAP